MSKIGFNPIKIEEGVEITVDGKEVKAKGPKGELSLTLPFKIDLEQKENELFLTRKNEEKETKSLHGTFRSLLANMITGVKEGYVKNLELVGVGYRAKLEGTTLVMNLGLTHPVEMNPIDGVTVEVPEETKIVVSGIDKQKVGEFAAKIREIRKPEPYKGKGIRYEGEYVRRKSAKAAVAA